MVQLHTGAFLLPFKFEFNAEPMNKTQEVSQQTAFSKYFPALAFLLISILIFLLRLPHSTQAVIDWDEGVHFTMTADWLRGGIPYLTAWDHKPPGLYLILAPVIYLFGANLIALRIFTTLYLLLSMVVLYQLSRKIWGRNIAVLPPLFYGLLFSGKDFGGLASNGELFMMLPVLIAFLAAFIYLESRKNR